MSDDPTTDVNAAAIAQAAIAIARQADAKAETALSGCRTFHKNLGNLADGLRQLTALVESLQTRLGELVFDAEIPIEPDDPDGVA